MQNRHRAATGVFVAAMVLALGVPQASQAAPGGRLAQLEQWGAVRLDRTYTRSGKARTPVIRLRTKAPQIVVQYGFGDQSYSVGRCSPLRSCSGYRLFKRATNGWKVTLKGTERRRRIDGTIVVSDNDGKTLGGAFFAIR